MEILKHGEENQRQMNNMVRTLEGTARGGNRYEGLVHIGLGIRKKRQN